MNRWLLISCMTFLAAGCSDGSDGPVPLDGSPAPDLSLQETAPPGDSGPPTLQWKQVSAGGAHTCAVRSDNTAWCWGSNSNGQLGNGTASSSPTPVRVKGLSNVTQIDADWVHTCAVNAQGTAYCWGENDGMQIGDPMAETNYPSCLSGGCTLPVQVIKIDNVAAVGTGARHSCAVLGNGQAWCWGFNEFGQLGNGNMPNDSASPVQVNGLANASGISGSAWHTCASTKDGQAFCWGDNTDGNLGVDSPAESDQPIAVAGVPNVAEIVAGDVHTCARTKGGRVFCFGDNRAGQLGTGTTQGGHVPVEVAGPSGARSVSTAVDHSCAVDGQGGVWCWGSNGTDSNGDGVPEVVTGKLGLPTSVKNELNPALVGGVAHAAAVTTGDDHTCALTANGEIWCWGSNADGQLGVSAGVLSPTPLKVPVPAQQ
jgi:alpha-tubulin suppressor-like RCC1 family protein